MIFLMEFVNVEFSAIVVSLEKPVLEKSYMYKTNNFILNFSLQVFLIFHFPSIKTEFVHTNCYSSHKNKWDFYALCALLNLSALY